MAEIDIQPAGKGSGVARFHVTVREGNSISVHDVTVTDGDYRRMGKSFGSYEEFVQASFEFLLEREPKESILSRFDISDIPRYFPEFERGMAGRRR